MAKLTEEIQTFIVQAHACFRKPSLIIRDVEAEFTVTVTRDQVQFYHPEKGDPKKRLGKKWVKLFEETRKTFVDGKVLAGIAYQTYRLELYKRGADYYESMGNYVLASEMAERAAKDLGGAWTNTRVHSGPGGGAIPIALEDKKKELAGKMLKKLVDKGMNERDARASLISMGVDERDIPTLQGS